MPVDKKEMIREFTKAIRKKSAAVFAGAGLSRPSGYVDWKWLLLPLAEGIHLNGDYENDLLSVGQYYSNEKGTRAGINQRLVQEFTRCTETSENVRILTKLPISTYWTTNYDRLLEDSLRIAGRNPDVKYETEQMAVPMYDRDAVVYKMHGDASNPAHAVLTKDDYEMYGYRRPMFRIALKGDLISKALLFVCFSFEDPKLDYILGQIHSLMEENIRERYSLNRQVTAILLDRIEFAYLISQFLRTVKDCLKTYNLFFHILNNELWRVFIVTLKGVPEGGDMQNILASIPARSGSKSVKGKKYAT